MEGGSRTRESEALYEIGARSSLEGNTDWATSQFHAAAKALYSCSDRWLTCGFNRFADEAQVYKATLANWLVNPDSVWIRSLAHYPPLHDNRTLFYRVSVLAAIDRDTAGEESADRHMERLGAAWRDYVRATGDISGRRLFAWLASSLPELTTKSALRAGRMAPLIPVIEAHLGKARDIRTGTLHAAEHALWQREDRKQFGD